MNETQFERNYENDIYYTASLVEFTARATHNRVSDIAKAIGLDGIKWAYEYAEVHHCLTFEQVCDELCEHYSIQSGEFDALASKPEGIHEPSFLSIRRSYSDLVVDIEKDPQKYPEALYRVFCSPISDLMSDYKSAFFYSPRDYLYFAYLELTQKAG